MEMVSRQASSFSFSQPIEPGGRNAGGYQLLESVRAQWKASKQVTLALALCSSIDGQQGECKPASQPVDVIRPTLSVVRRLRRQPNSDNQAHRVECASELLACLCVSYSLPLRALCSQARTAHTSKPAGASGRRLSG